MREARRPREGAVIFGSAGEGTGLIVDRAWWGVEAEMWCQVRE